MYARCTIDPKILGLFVYKLCTHHNICMCLWFIFHIKCSHMHHYRFIADIYMLSIPEQYFLYPRAFSILFEICFWPFYIFGVNATMVLSFFIIIIYDGRYRNLHIRPDQKNNVFCKSSLQREFCKNLGSDTNWAFKYSLLWSTAVTLAFKQLEF